MWKDVKNYEGLYQINENGDIKSLIGKSKLLSPFVDKRGYTYVTLSKNSKATKLLLHRLVAEAFIPNPDNLPCINHKDANPTNNNVNNLEWCTYKYNSNYYLCKEKQSDWMLNRYKKDPEFLQKCRDRLDVQHKLRAKKVCQIDMSGELVHIWNSARETDLYGYFSTNVTSCANGHRKTHRGYKWIWLTDYLEKAGD